MLGLGLLGACNSVLGIEERGPKRQGLVSCDARSASSGCGLSESGKPLVCFAAWQLGGQDFCVESCDPVASPGDGFACLGSGALIQRCQVSDSPAAADAGPACPAGLQCYRTDLLSNDGLCLTVPTCSSPDDCAIDGVHTTCAKTLVSTLSMGQLNPDHLFCIKQGCRSTMSACPSSETCLPTQYDFGGGLGDLCVPNCDDGRCPPNFACAKTDVAPGSEAICLPGLPGIRCVHDEDCLLGKCVQIDEMLAVCSTDCTSDLDCGFLNYNSLSDIYTCVDNHCITPRSFFGSNCFTRSDCSSGRQCFDYFPYQGDPTAYPGHGDCRTPCDTNAQCSPQGGLPHVCLNAQMGGCFPGMFGVPCANSSECLPGLSCEDVPADFQTWAQGYTKMCTLACQTDCSGSLYTNVRGFCGEGICLVRAEAQAACQTDDQCLSGLCHPGLAGASGACAAVTR